MKKYYSDIEVNGKLTLKNGGGCIFATNPSGNACVEIDGNLYAIPHYRVGDIFISTLNTSPSIRFGGTWEQITADAYLKIVTSGAGALGGTNSQHKIPIESMTPHRHELVQTYGSGNLGGGIAYAESASEQWLIYTNYQGDGNPYYPYYYGVYAWVKRA